MPLLTIFRFTMASVHCRYPRCKGSGTGREADKQGDGKYQEEIQRFLTLFAAIFPCPHHHADGNLDGYQKKKYASFVFRILWAYSPQL
jgi:hypothetical protein